MRLLEKLYARYTSAIDLKLLFECDARMHYKNGPPAVKITMNATFKAKMMDIMPFTVRLTYTL